MEIKNVAIIGAGAVGAYFLWGMKDLTEGNVCVLAKDGRGERLKREGIIVNGEKLTLKVKSPAEAGRVDLLLISTKYDALPEILEDVRAVTGKETIVMAALNGVDSEEVVGRFVGEEHMLYSFMRIAAERKGNVVTFDPAVTQGLMFGEKESRTLTVRARAVLDFFKKTACRATFREDIQSDLWHKYAMNIARNLPQAILGTGVGAITDSVHMEFISRRLWEEVMSLAKARHLTTWPYEAPTAFRKESVFSTLQDIRAKRHTEIEMFAGVMVRLAKESGVSVPYCEYTYHLIKALEEKNDGKFAYGDGK